MVGFTRAAVVLRCALLVASTLLVGCTVDRAASASAPSGPAVSILQLNLCDSGLAPCYTAGRAVVMAATLIRERRPDIVTVDEVCRADVSALRTAMSATFGDRRVAAAFRPAMDRRTGGPYLCRNGDQYGIGVLTAIPTSSQSSARALHQTISGVYPTQDGNDPEERVWVCIDAAAMYTACATHLASTAVTIAYAQCRYFLRSAIPILPTRTDHAPVILAGDLNLLGRGPLGVQSCLLPGYQRVGDGALQHVITSPGTAVLSSAHIDMNGTTDHPGLLVHVGLPRSPR
ncbi:endonuclease/exonuclease/phosphatase family protein [Microlunatus sp. Gsoil 973]|uniref:endonuclease/exonuclease/phosphatase family protein n=1 Tax=Microlunatus sp. Gsoil 973 TaxID=2672569 RepID=UPI0012B48CD4|nr:endonuclease/exonuclease/phosphatase family protein [Microlunatus sp. Gsoil 973]QGN34895.1 endonuclease/exonuclease/phosphatase family protein [Microlunatus sp. Gsoil 973]